ncbi:unnamed protein product [Dibothriocephalus latus]|uniref:Uncharacterized protein n=1 Tax=Dibothriocephalus latus TaxID=60516 RepID=A0A3P7N0G1_DIBLA|nr:unnamed protein product [Dibothriocephalus latus]
MPLPVESTASKEERLTDTQLEDECAISSNDGPISEMDRDKTSPSSPDIGSLDSDLTMETEVDSDDGNESTNSICSSSASNQTVNDKPTPRLTVPPWHQDQCFGLEQQQQLTPRQLRRLALEVASLKRIRPTALDWPRLLPSFGPICRIPFLPTTSHCGIQWFTLVLRIPLQMAFCIVSSKGLI